MVAKVYELPCPRWVLEMPPLPHEPLRLLPRSKPVLLAPDHLTGVSAGYSFGCLFPRDSCCDLTAYSPARDLGRWAR